MVSPGAATAIAPLREHGVPQLVVSAVVVTVRVAAPCTGELPNIHSHATASVSTARITIPREISARVATHLPSLNDVRYWP